MPVLIRDFETRSTINLKKFGAWRYATHPDTDVLCCAYCVDDGPVALWVPGDPVPPEWIRAAQDPEWLVSAFNDNFERQIEAHIMSPRYGWPLVPIERHQCLRASALALALPDKLGTVAEALGLEHQKETAGKINMMALSRPRKPHKGEPAGVYWINDPARLERLYSYCCQDVEAERSLYKRIGFLPPDEQVVWQLDAAINDRGIYVDQELALAAAGIAGAGKQELNAELAKLTGSEITSAGQTDRILKWLSEHGCPVENIRKETLGHALTRKDISPEVRRLMDLRKEGAPIAASKFGSMLAWRNADGRMRGALQYHGAHTGRWSSHGVQLQNAKKQHDVEDMQPAIDAVMTGDLGHLRRLYPEPMALVGAVTRAALAAAPGHRFVIADFSGIESRVLALLAGEQSKTEQWRKFDQTHLVDDEPYTINGKRLGFSPAEARSKGKVGDLAFGFGGGKPAWRRFAPNDKSTDDEIKR
jgi:DNA polymerase bacteriophage-type